MNFAPDIDDPRLHDHKFWGSLPRRLPPVLRGDLKVEALYADAILFRVDRDFGEVQVLLYHGPPSDFRYWVWDEASCLVSNYQGPFGDPAADDLIGEYMY